MAGKQVVKSEIILDHNKTHYERGEQVSGVLNLTIKGSVQLADIQIGLYCKAEVKWLENYNGIVDYKEVTYLPNKGFEDSKQYLDLKYDLHNEYAYDFVRQLCDGNHTISFKFQLPESAIPSSFIGDNGSINYYVEAIIEEEHRISAKIFVSSPIRSQLKLSVGGSIKKEFGTLDSASGKIAFHTSVNKKGFIAGEQIVIYYFVWNESTLDVTPRATLFKEEIYMCGERHKAIKHLLVEPTIGPEIKKNTNLSDNLVISIPNDVVLSLKSTLISVKYFIHVTLESPHAKDLHLNVPIIITDRKVED